MKNFFSYFIFEYEEHQAFSSRSYNKPIDEVMRNSFSTLIVHWVLRTKWNSFFYFFSNDFPLTRLRQVEQLFQKEQMDSFYFSLISSKLFSSETIIKNQRRQAKLSSELVTGNDCHVEQKEKKLKTRIDDYLSYRLKVSFCSVKKFFFSHGKTFDIENLHLSSFHLRRNAQKIIDPFFNMVYRV